MRYAIIYLLITIAFIAATIYIAYTLYNITSKSIERSDMLQAIKCIYTKSICIVTKPIVIKRVSIKGEQTYVIIIGSMAIPTTKPVEGNCTNPPCIIITTTSGITIQEMSEK